MVSLPEGDWEYVYALDEGYTDPCAINIFAFNRYDGQLLHVYCFEQRENMFARTIAELLLGPNRDADNPAGLFGATGWPSFFVGDLGEGLHLELRNVYGINVDRWPRKADYKHDAIELTNGDLLDGRIKVLKGSALEKQIETLQWSVDDYGHLKEHKGMANHSTDCLIMARDRALHSHREERPRPQPAPGSQEAVKQWEDESLKQLLQKGKGDDFSGMLADAGEGWEY
jgi:hypothetical protein